MCLAGVHITDFSLVGVLKVADLRLAWVFTADFFPVGVLKVTDMSCRGTYSNRCVCCRGT